jgi:hypothetical protein
LSARIIPYFFSAVRITWFWGEKEEILKPAFSRSRVPIAGALGSVTEDAQCDAGGVKALRVTGTVKRSACFIAPAATSSYRASPAKIGRPAASAEVQV